MSHCWKVQGPEKRNPGQVWSGKLQVAQTPWRGWGGFKTGRDDAGPRVTLLLESPLLCHLLKGPGARGRGGTGVRETKLHGDTQTTWACLAPPVIPCPWPILAHGSLDSDRTPTPTAVSSTGTGTISRTAPAM